jgi:hypothetical protein
LKEIEKGRNDLDNVMNNISMLFYNWTLCGFNNPTPDEKNYLASQFEELQTISRLYNGFVMLKSLIQQSDDVKESLNNLSLTVCNLLRNETPPLLYKPLIRHCWDLRIMDKSKIQLLANIVWNEMKNPVEILIK